ncbi:MAG: hypothetical protein ACK4HF_02850 [Paracoccaceae bacterium]
MADPYTTTTNSTTTAPVHPTSTTTTHIRDSGSPTNWFAYLLGGAVIAVGVGALVLSNSDSTPTTTPAGSTNNVTIESPAAPAPAVEAPAATAPAPVEPAPTAPAPETTPDAGTVAPAPAN